MPGSDRPDLDALTLLQEQFRDSIDEVSPDARRPHAAALVSTLAGLEPEQRAWTLLDDGVAQGDRTGTVAFWDRRQKLETLIHLWDLRTAGGLQVEADCSAGVGCRWTAVRCGSQAMRSWRGPSSTKA